MRISARCDYACRAILELSLRWPLREPVQIHTIAEQQNIPLRYLVNILIQLKRMGVVMSLRGKEGGYSLTRPPNKITLGEVLREIEGPLLPVANTTTVFAPIWNEVENAMAKVLDEITFEDISNKIRGINYQI